MTGKGILIKGATLYRSRLPLSKRRREARGGCHRQVRTPLVKQADRCRIRLQSLPGPIGQTGQNLLNLYHTL
jgi:hypothetical protein